MFLPHLFFIFLLSLVLCVVRGDLLIAQGRIPIRAYGLNQNYASEYRFTANLPTNVYTNAWIEIVFPPDFVLTSDCLSYVRTDASDTEFKPYPCVKQTATSYNISVGQITSGKYEIYVQGVTNPAGRPGSGTFKIRTYSGSIRIDSNDFFGDVPLLDSTGNYQKPYQNCCESYQSSSFTLSIIKKSNN